MFKVYYISRRDGLTHRRDYFLSLCSTRLFAVFWNQWKHMKKAVLYARVSSDLQKKERLVPRHARKLTGVGPNFTVNKSVMGFAPDA
jgi:hypothetical protein